MKAKALIVAALLAVSLSGCGLHYIGTETVDTPDGRHVLCIWKKVGYAGGLSCDWNGAKR